MMSPTSIAAGNTAVDMLVIDELIVLSAIVEQTARGEGSFGQQLLQHRGQPGVVPDVYAESAATDHEPKGEVRPALPRGRVEPAPRFWEGRQRLALVHSGAGQRGDVGERSASLKYLG